MVDVTLVRKLAEEKKGESALLELTTTEPDAYELLYESKIASVDNPVLLLAAAKLRDDPEEIFGLYEEMGGGYKYAFGTSMFQTGGVSQQSQPGQPGQPGKLPGAPKPIQPQAGGAPKVPSPTSVQR